MAGGERPSETPVKKRRARGPVNSMTVVTTESQYEKVFEPAAKAVGENVKLTRTGDTKKDSKRRARGKVKESTSTYPQKLQATVYASSRDDLVAFDRAVQARQPAYYAGLGVRSIWRVGLHPEVADLDGQQLDREMRKKYPRSRRTSTRQAPASSSPNASAQSPQKKG